MMQLIVNISILFSITTLVGIACFLRYSTTKFFDLSQASTISLAAYFTYAFNIGLRLPLLIAIMMGILCSTAIAIGAELIVYRHMRRKEFPPFASLIASLGLYTVVQNSISLFFGDDAKTLRSADVEVGHMIAGAYITNSQIATLVVSLTTFLAVLLILQRSTLGKRIRAISDNRQLSDIYGINSSSLILVAIGMAALLAGIAGILISLDVDMSPTFGFNYYLGGVIAMIISGAGNYRGLIIGSALLTTAQHLAAFFMDTKWMAAVAFFILILFLIWRPRGVGGQRLKKVEV